MNDEEFMEKYKSNGRYLKNYFFGLGGVFAVFGWAGAAIKIANMIKGEVVIACLLAWIALWSIGGLIVLYEWLTRRS